MRLDRTPPESLTLYFMMSMLCMASKLHSTDVINCCYAIELLLLSYVPKEPRSAVVPKPLSLWFACSGPSIHYRSDGIEMC